jgi:Holliday junction resolvasome RuvABC endonuclease subunit
MFHNLNPDYGVAEHCSTLVSIDPGSESLGVSIYTLDSTFEVVKIEAATYRGSKLPMQEDIILSHGERAARIQAHEDNLFSLFLQYQPIGIACESPFFQATRPQAYGALTEVVAAIRRAIMRYRSNLELFLIDPPSVKKAVGAKGNAGKDDVKNAIINLQAIDQVYNGPIPLWLLDEHSLDAIAVGRAYHQTLRGKE